MTSSGSVTNVIRIVSEFGLKFPQKNWFGFERFKSIVQIISVMKWRPIKYTQTAAFVSRTNHNREMTIRSDYDQADLISIGRARGAIAPKLL